MTFFVIPEIPEWFGKAAQSHFRESGKALFLNLSNYHTRIVAEEIYGKIYLEDPQAPDCPPSMTWREYAEQYTGMSIEEYASEFDLSTDSWDDEADSDLVRDDWIENGPRSETASGMVYFLLEDLDLGRTHISLDELQIEQILGYVEFIDGDSPGHDYLGVRVSSPVALSALQYRLDELGTGIKIDMG